MASNVAQPLERQFSLIAGLSQMTSTSALGSTQITLQFDLNRAIDAAALDVQSAINAAGRPAARQPAEPADLPQGQSGRLADHAAGGAVRHAAADQVNDYADNILAQQISQISGVGQVDIGGAQKPVGARAGGSGQARRHGHEPGGHPHASSRPLGQPAQRQRRRRRRRASTVYTTTSFCRPSPGTTWCSPIATARRCGCATSGVAVDGPENDLTAGGLPGPQRRRAPPSTTAAA